MSFTHVVVDGSNIATEGRSMPSLAQLDEAVREFQREFPHADITVVVDATFGHRIDQSERAVFDEAQAHGELVSPPAGAIGRGDAFLLRIADKAGATVLSNDSFQEFHGEYEWLFTKGRLIGGKPVPGVGWIFTPRTPVRGPKSREAVREARRGRVRVGSPEASQPMPVPKAPPPGPRSSRPSERHPEPPSSVSDAIATATEEVVSEGPSAGRRRRRRGSVPHDTLNEPLTFITFIAAHPLGAEVEGEVDSFSSHGAFVIIADARCYVPLSAMGDPPPRSARQVMRKGEKRTFVVQAFDAQRRGIELALPGFAQISGAPQEETVEAEIAQSGSRRRRGRRTPDSSVPEAASEIMAPEVQQATAEATPGPDGERTTAGRRRRSKKDEVAATAPVAGQEETAPKPRRGRKAVAATVAVEAASEAPTAEAAAPAARARKAAATKAAASRKTTTAKAAAAEAPAETAATPAKRATARKTAAAKAPAKAATTKTAAKVSATKAPAVEKAATTKAAAKKTAATGKTAATKSVTAKTATAKAGLAKTTGAEKTPAKTAAAKAAAKTPAKKSPTKAAGKDTSAAKAASARTTTPAKKAAAKAPIAKKTAKATTPATKTPAKEAAARATKATAAKKATNTAAAKTTKATTSAAKAAPAAKTSKRTAKTGTEAAAQPAKAAGRRTAKTTEPVSRGRRRGPTTD